MRTLRSLLCFAALVSAGCAGMGSQPDEAAVWEFDGLSIVPESFRIESGPVGEVIFGAVHNGTCRHVESATVEILTMWESGSVSSRRSLSVQVQDLAPGSSRPFEARTRGPIHYYSVVSITPD